MPIAVVPSVCPRTAASVVQFTPWRPLPNSPPLHRWRAPRPAGCGLALTPSSSITATTSSLHCLPGRGQPWSNHLGTHAVLARAQQSPAGENHVSTPTGLMKRMTANLARAVGLPGVLSNAPGPSTPPRPRGHTAPRPPLQTLLPHLRPPALPRERTPTPSPPHLRAWPGPRTRPSLLAAWRHSVPVPGPACRGRTGPTSAATQGRGQERPLPHCRGLTPNGSLPRT